MMDERWKLSKSYSTKNTSSTAAPGSCSSTSNFTRSFSTRSSSTTNSTTAGTSTSYSKSPFLRRSSSLKYGGGGSGGEEGFSEKGGSASITRKCTNLAKEQKARFYIMRRCVAMLVCWHKHADP